MDNNPDVVDVTDQWDSVLLFGAIVFTLFAVNSLLGVILREAYMPSYLCFTCILVICSFTQFIMMMADRFSAEGRLCAGDYLKPNDVAPSFLMIRKG